MEEGEIMEDSPRRFWSDGILREIDSLDCNRVQTEIEACPNCVYSNDGEVCDKLLYAIGVPLCIRYRREDSNKRYIGAHCGDCGQLGFGCAIHDNLENGKREANELAVDEMVPFCAAIKYVEYSEERRREMVGEIKRLEDL